jgi:hypothetical protein
MTIEDLVLNYEKCEEKLKQLSPAQFAAIPQDFIRESLRLFHSGEHAASLRKDRRKQIVKNLRSFVVDFIGTPVLYILFLKLITEEEASYYKEKDEEILNAYLDAYPDENDKIVKILCASREIFSQE